ncbi:hypothetical protein LGT39_14015 [Demequina sp. TTPB684]|nr:MULTISPECIES: hypothetical protein [unclassified Demequina]MCB2413963.1 hypothetical protein [Demequina sp. TTPB684]UPU88684.1 hypothetical protein LGT36_001815 [Demequina sp. TMPB413]
MNDAVSAILLTAALASAGFYMLYVVVRRAVRDGIQDASTEPGPTSEETT